MRETVFHAGAIDRYLSLTAVGPDSILYPPLSHMGKHQLHHKVRNLHPKNIWLPGNHLSNPATGALRCELPRTSSRCL